VDLALSKPNQHEYAKLCVAGVVLLGDDGRRHHGCNAGIVPASGCGCASEPMNETKSMVGRKQARARGTQV
jgi:hypothetical protein